MGSVPTTLACRYLPADRDGYRLRVIDDVIISDDIAVKGMRIPEPRPTARCGLIMREIHAVLLLEAVEENFEALSAYHLAQSPNLDGDFAKWESGPTYRLAEGGQVAAEAKLWHGPQDLSARVALAWDASYLYVGVDVSDPEIYQPFFARGIQNGDAFLLNLETGFRKNFLAVEPTGDEYELYFSPGDFAGVEHSIFSDEDYLPPRVPPHNYMQEIFTAWKKTAGGYSGDIAIPVNYFEGDKFAAGYELGLELGVQKVMRPARPLDPDDLERIILLSKKDRLFRVRTSNPSSFPRVVLTEEKH